MAKIVYSSNNSGGDWWLKDEDWYALEKAGWTVRWVKDDEWWKDKVQDDGRWLGALAMKAEYPGDDLRKAIDSFEAVTGQYSNDLGCSCCGAPHSFELRDDDDNWVGGYTPSYPERGERY